MRLTYKSLSLLLTSALLATSTLAADPIKVPLTPQLLEETSIQSPRMVRADLIFGETIKFAQGATEVPFTFAGEKCTFLRQGNDNLSFRTPNHSYNLEKWPDNRCGRQPLLLTLADKRTYNLAFAHGHFYAHDDNNNPNLIPGELVCASGQTLSGTLDSQPISLYDDNVDGFYTLEDAIATSSAPSKMYLPLSKFIATPKGIYEITSLAKDGSQLQCTPYAGPTAPMTLTTTSNAGEFQLVLTSTDAQFNFLAAATDKAPAKFNAIPGSYQIAYGQVYSPTDKAPIAQIKPGQMAPLKISDKQAPAIALTGPVAFQFSPTLKDGKLTINPNDFHFLGKSGEEYINLRYDTETPPEIKLNVGKKSILNAKMAFG